MSSDHELSDFVEEKDSCVKKKQHTVLEKSRRPPCGSKTTGFSVIGDSRVGIQSPEEVSTEIVVGQLEKDTDDDDDDYDPGCFSRAVDSVQEMLTSWYSKYCKHVWWAIYILVLLGWIAYSTYAMYYNFRGGFDASKESPVRLMALNAVAILCVGYWAAKRYAGKKIYTGMLKPIVKNVTKCHEKFWFVLKWIYAAAVVAAIALIVILDVGMSRPQNLYSGIGLLVYVALFFIFSSNPARVRWRPVIWGLVLQFAFAYLILRTCWGYTLFQWLGDRVQEFLKHTDEGSMFVFGKLYEDHFFAFKALPVIIFFSTIISMLYYLGWMQVIIVKIAWVMQVTMGTTAGESLNAAANIFVGQTEAPLIIKPLLRDMTKSELHAIMTGGFATIAGSVLATYILFGVPANHLLSASVMSAPAALAMSKLFYPETKRSRTTLKAFEHIEKGPEQSLIEAAASGASMAVALVANIAANLIAFLAVKKFLNETLKWLGAQVGLAPPNYPDFTFEFICSYVLWPFAWVMGADAMDCGEVASLIGIKTFTNEFVAYEQLSDLIKNRKAIEAYDNKYANSMPSANYSLGSETSTTLPPFLSTPFDAIKNVTSHLNGTYSKDFDAIRNCWALGDGRCLRMITERSEMIAVYALCGFANLGSIGIMIGGLGSLAPERRKDMIAVVVRAMIAGNVACFMTACIAGLLSNGSTSC